VELLLGDEGDAFAFTGNIENDVMSITAVHPMREDALTSLLRKAGASWDIIEKMIQEGKILKLRHHATNFYMRRLHCRVPVGSKP